VKRRRRSAISFRLDVIRCSPRSGCNTEAATARPAGKMASDFSVGFDPMEIHADTPRDRLPPHQPALTEKMLLEKSAGTADTGGKRFDVGANTTHHGSALSWKAGATKDRASRRLRRGNSSRRAPSSRGPKKTRS